jgi:hypothetical protein
MEEDAMCDECSELKRKLAEAEKALAGHHEPEGSCGCIRCDLKAAEVRLEVEQLERQRMTAAFNIAKGLEERLRSEFQKETRARDAAERKCAELSEALRAVKFEDENANNLTSYTRDLVDAALASQPAPEAKPKEWVNPLNQKCIKCGKKMNDHFGPAWQCFPTGNASSFTTDDYKPTPEAP